ncbi:MAG: hypothetical protein WCH34_13025 [Bacteroidota bacterium]
MKKSGALGCILLNDKKNSYLWNMKTNKKDKAKSTIEQLREIREKINDETQNMTYEQLQKYINDQLKDSIHPNAVWQ